MLDSSVSRHLRCLFIGFQDQDNLGLRYLMSSAQSAGHDTEIQTFEADPRPILEAVRQKKPDFIGFSLIFQFMTRQFADVIEALREAGVTAHISVGGHFPSFNHQSVMDAAPGIDSVIRFEGEATMTDLLAALATDQDWSKIPGLAARLLSGDVRSNPLRGQIMELDTLPWPERADIAYERADQPTAAILGSRGCPWNCDFCSIRPFYEAQEGSLRRLRSPKDVVEEMRHLFHDRGVALFLFQDDDFLATGSRARQWAGEIADRIAESDIGGHVAWKMSCRSDELRPDIIAQMKRGGLTHVYMGVESGDETGLKNMNKLLKPEKHIAAGNMLRDAGLSFDFGFMLLDPWSDFVQVRNNIDFLDAFVGDGWSVAGFCRMLPYAGTPIEKRLGKEGRLIGTEQEPDYRFLDTKLDRFYAWMLETFHTRNFTTEGLSHILRGMVFESRIQVDHAAWMSREETRWLQYIVSRSNKTATTALRLAVDYFEETPYDEIAVHSGYLAILTEREKAEEQILTRQLEAFWNEPERRTRRRARQDARLAGGFDQSWTFAENEFEARGVGVR
ncbi:B12-binding domain-containing radical SAM protein [Rhodobacteraceae bacterium S2214]|nr:B12-binding domain-containing radical SAM protein [Rhodobacteraceae bacterium S2214]